MEKRGGAVGAALIRCSKFCTVCGFRDWKPARQGLKWGERKGTNEKRGERKNNQKNRKTGESKRDRIESSLSVRLWAWKLTFPCKRLRTSWNVVRNMVFGLSMAWVFGNSGNLEIFSGLAAMVSY